MDDLNPICSEKLERSVLGCIFLNSDAYFTAAERLEAPAFWYEKHRHVWRAVGELLDDEEPVDEITVAEHLQADGKLEAVGGASYLTRLANAVPSVANLDGYLEQLETLWRRRKLQGVGRKLAHEATSGESEPDELEARVVEAIRKNRESQRRTKLSSNEIDARLDEELEPSSDSQQAHSTGITQLDRIWSGGIVDARTYYVLGLSKMGKTTLTVDITEHLLSQHDFAVDFWSTEMGHTELEAKYLAKSSQFDAEEALNAIRALEEDHTHEDPLDVLGEDQARDLLSARRDFRRYDLEIAVEGRPDVRDVELEARRRLSELDHDRYAIVVDFLQNFTAGDDVRGRGGRFADYDEVAHRLNDLAKSYGVPIFILAQFDKDSEKRFTQQSERPRFSDARGLSRSSNDANHLVVVHRPYREDDGEAAKYTEVHQDLSRHGWLGATARLGFDAERCSFHSWRGSIPSDNKQNREDQSYDWRSFGGGHD